MQIVEDLEKWTTNFHNGWLKEFNQNNRIDWNLYSYVKNNQAPRSTGIDSSKSKLLLVSSAGGYLPSKDSPFDAKNQLGDYSIRTFPISTNFNEIQYSHEHYDTAAVKQDAQVLLPLRHLTSMVTNKSIGELCNTVVSFMGYQPDVNKVISETIPAIWDIVKKEKIDAVLLVPS